MGDRQADLMPPLGWRGGPCKVVERIENEVRNPKLRHELSEKAEHGQKLTNPEAAKVYSLERDKGGGIFRQVAITPHAQYRMDGRGVTVGDLRVALMNFSRKLNDWKSQQAWEWDNFQRDSMRGEPIEWIDKKLGDLKVVFVNDRGTARIISTYWKGQADPGPETCSLHPRHAGIQPETEFGVKTWTKKDHPEKSDTDSGKYPTRALPTPPWSKSRPPHAPVFNVPGESGSDSGGTVHKDKVRTKGAPGGQYDNDKTHPTPDITDSQITPHRRPSMAAGMDEWDDLDEDILDVDVEVMHLAYKPRYPGFHPPANMREHEQKPQPSRYDKKRYKRMKGRYRPKAKMRARRLRFNNRVQQRKEKAREMPQRHERKPPTGARTIAERSKKQREKAKRANHTVEFDFFHFPTEEWGTIIEVSPLGMVHVEWDDGDRDAFGIETLLDEVVLAEEDIDPFFAYLDQVFDYDEDDDELAEAFDDEADELFDTWLEGGMVRLAWKPVLWPKRRRRRKGEEKIKRKQRYRLKRVQELRGSKKRRKVYKRHPSYKRIQKIRRKHPERRKMILAYVLTAPDIAFAVEDTNGELLLGYVRNISGCTGWVHFWLVENGKRMLYGQPVRIFLRDAIFLSEEDEAAMFDLIDAEVGIEAYGDPEELGDGLVNLYTIESEFMHPVEKRWGEPEPGDELLIDPEDGDFYYGAVNKLASRVIGTFFREQRPPDMDPDTKFDRGTPLDKAREDRKKERRKHPGDNFYPYMDEVSDSNPGSRVLPTGKGHVTDKNAALIREIREGNSADLLARSEGLQVKLSRVDQKNAVWLFNVEGSKSPYRVRLKAQRQGNTRDLQKLHVKVSCSCPFWQWQGPEHWAKQGDYLYGKPRGLATKPDVKDPNGQHRACKHVLAVLQHVSSKPWMGVRRSKQARYLADTLRLAEMVAEYPDIERSVRRVAARYLAALEVRDA
jgi:hypothetical protein